MLPAELLAQASRHDGATLRARRLEVRLSRLPPGCRSSGGHRERVESDLRPLLQLDSGVAKLDLAENSGSGLSSHTWLPADGASLYVSRCRCMHQAVRTGMPALCDAVSWVAPKSPSQLACLLISVLTRPIARAHVSQAPTMALPGRLDDHTLPCRVRHRSSRQLHPSHRQVRLLA